MGTEPSLNEEETDLNPFSRQNRWPALVIAVRVFFVMVATLLILALLTYPDDVAFEFRGREVQATIDRVQLKRFSRYDENTLHYSFIDPDGITQYGETRVVLDDRAPRYQTGDKIRVQYRLDEPTRNRPTRNSKLRSVLGDEALTFLIGGLLTLQFLVLLFLITRRNSILTFVAFLGRLLPGLGRRIWRRRQVTTSAEEGPTFSFTWEKALRQNMALYARLAPAEQKLLQDLMLDFIPSRPWTGAEGLTITEEMKATVAGQACVLLLGIKEHNLYASVTEVILHPTQFADVEDRVLNDADLDDKKVILGQAWYRGPVLLSWQEVLEGGRDADNGRNVVYHEFAHQLDFQGLDLADTVSEETRAIRQHWSEVLQREYNALVTAVHSGQETLLDSYGATNSMEFFAVATECFFEKPIEMQQTYPALYDVFRSFYGQDSAGRMRAYHSNVELLRRKTQTV